MEFEFTDPDSRKKTLGVPVPDIIAKPTNPDGEFIIRDPQYGEQVVHQLDFYYVANPSSLSPEVLLNEHVVAQDDPGWFRLGNIIGYAAIRPYVRRSKQKESVTVRVRDFKETQPYNPKNT
jgi:hypothetical protein